MKFTLTPFIIDPANCGPIIYTCEVISGSRTDLCSFNDGSTSGSFDSVTGDFHFNSIDTVNFLPGTYTFKIIGTEGSLSAFETFTVTLVDPCPTSTLTFINPSPFVD